MQTNVEALLQAVPTNSPQEFPTGSYGLASDMALLEPSTAFSDRQMHGAGPTLEAAARPSGSKDSYLAACRRVLLETIGVGLYFALKHTLQPKPAQELTNRHRPPPQGVGGAGSP